MEETRWEGQNFSEVVAPQEEEEEEEEEEDLLHVSGHEYYHNAFAKYRTWGDDFRLHNLYWCILD